MAAPQNALSLALVECLPRDEVAVNNAAHRLGTAVFRQRVFQGLMGPSGSSGVVEGGKGGAAAWSGGVLVQLCEAHLAGAAGSGELGGAILQEAGVLLLQRL